MFTARYGLGYLHTIQVNLLVQRVSTSGGQHGSRTAWSSRWRRYNPRRVVKQLQIDPASHPEAGPANLYRALAHGNFEERNKVLVSSISIINSFIIIIIINAHYNYVV